jgi:RNA polymerase sigma-70 factor (ECF subfamily)
MSVTDRAGTFEEHRGRMFGIAYRMLGSVTDAEDVVQDAWLKWSQADRPVEKPGAYLARTVANLSLNRLTSAAAQREHYVGPWLPEPLVGTAPDVADDAELAESVSLAMLVVLESLSPLERAVFILREVFGYPFREVAEVLGRSEVAVRQLAVRAKSHVAARRPRYRTSAAEQRRVTEQFLTACLGGDLGRLMELLAPDVTVWTDGGGKVTDIARRPIHGARYAARGALEAFRRLTDLGAIPALVNGRPGVVLTSGGAVDSVLCLEVADGRITEVRVVRNPDKLRHVTI